MYEIIWKIWRLDMRAPTQETLSTKLRFFKSYDWAVISFGYSAAVMTAFLACCPAVSLVLQYHPLKSVKSCMEVPFPSTIVASFFNFIWCAISSQVK